MREKLETALGKDPGELKPEKTLISELIDEVMAQQEDFTLPYLPYQTSKTITRVPKRITPSSKCTKAEKALNEKEKKL